MKTNKGYVFISHSSKDIKKVREIRNVIELENGNPILFYLKCLDGDNPDVENEQLLKQLISKEIKARRKFLLCESLNTKPGKSNYIDWEIEEVKRLKAENPNLIQIEEVDIDNSKEEEYLARIREFVFKQDKILLVAAMEEYKICGDIWMYLKNLEMHVEMRVETPDMRHDVLYRYGQWTKDMVKSLIQEVLPRGIVVFIKGSASDSQTFMQMANSFLQKSAHITVDVSNGLSETMLKNLSERILAYMNT